MATGAVKSCSGDGSSRARHPAEVAQQSGEAGPQPFLLPYGDIGRGREIAAAALEQPTIARAAPAGDAELALLHHRFVDRPGGSGGSVDQPRSHTAAPIGLDRGHLERIRLPHRLGEGRRRFCEPCPGSGRGQAVQCRVRCPAVRCRPGGRSGRAQRRRWQRSRCRRGSPAAATRVAGAETLDWTARRHPPDSWTELSRGQSDVVGRHAPMPRARLRSRNVCCRRRVATVDPGSPRPRVRRGWNRRALPAPAARLQALVVIDPPREWRRWWRPRHGSPWRPAKRPRPRETVALPLR